MRELSYLDVVADVLWRPFDTLSGVQKKKALIACILCQKAHLYVWDEPLNFIDIYWRMHIEQLIEEFSPTMLFVEQTAFSKKRQQYEPL